MATSEACESEEFVSTRSLSGGFLGLLSERVADDPHRLAYRFIERSGAVRHVTRMQLWHDAHRLARQLSERGLADHRVLLACSTQWHFVLSFYACLLAGAIAVPTPSMASKRMSGRIRRLAADAGARLFICDSESGVRAAEMTGSPALDLRNEYIASDSMTGAKLNADLELQALSGLARSNASTLAFLQYTSGSTGDPKGVMVTHGNVLANCAAIEQGMAIGEHSRVLTALPLFHDMGLIGGVLQPLYSGCEGTFMEPAQVVLRPLAWLQAIERYGITHSGGPNFMFDAASQIDEADGDSAADAGGVQALDLRCWQVAYCGAEPVRRKTVDQFRERFSAQGFDPSAFYPCFGLAESTLFVSGGHLGRERDDLPEAENSSANSVSCGVVHGETHVELVDPETHTPVAAGCEGEIWVRGPSVAAGYWGQPELSAQVFGARMSCVDEGTGQGRCDGPYLRTGDLGRWIDGQLHVTGRIKDLLIFHGRKFAPQDLEQEVQQCHAAVLGCVAFSFDDTGVERLALALEVERHSLRDEPVHGAIHASVSRAIFSAFSLPVAAIVLGGPYSLPRTSSGKLMRTQTKRSFLAQRAPSTATAHTLPASGLMIELIERRNYEGLSDENVQRLFDSLEAKQLY